MSDYSLPSVLSACMPLLLDVLATLSRSSTGTLLGAKSGLLPPVAIPGLPGPGASGLLEIGLQ